MNTLRILAIWLAVSLIVAFFVWPDIAAHMEKLQKDREASARLKRLRDNWALVETIIAQEKAIELARLERELEARATEILLIAFNDDPDAMPFALDDERELPRAS